MWLLKPVLRIRFILIWIRIIGSVSWNNGSGSCSESDLKSGKYQLLFYFFFSIKKNIFLRNMIYFVIYGVNIYVSKHKFITVLRKKYMIFLWFSLIFVEIFHGFGWFFATRIWIRFIEADPDPADQNETDLNGFGSATLIKAKQYRSWAVNARNLCVVGRSQTSLKCFKQ